MKRYFFFFAALTIGAQVWAQPALTKANNAPQIGDSLTTYTVQNFSGNQGAAGANQTWDFSNLGTWNVRQGWKYVTCQSNTLCNENPGANIILNGAENMYEKISDSGISIIGTYEGIVSDRKFIHYLIPEKIMYYPLNYGDEDSSSWWATVVHSTNGPAEPTSERFGYTTVKADAYGTLITPAGTFQNVIRVKIQQVYTDSTPLYPTTPTTLDTTTIYSWYQPGNSNFLLSITTYKSKLSDQTTPIVPIRNLQYTVESSPTSIIGNQQAQIAAVYPNPASNFLKIRFKKNNVKVLSVRLINILGQVVSNLSEDSMQHGANGVFSLNVKQIPNGLYLLQIQTNSGTASRKIEVFR